MKIRSAVAVALMAVMAPFSQAQAEDAQASAKQVYEQYLKAAESGDADSMNRVGILYSQGIGVPQDYVAALAWYQRAAKQGSCAALGNIATMYYYGFGVPQSYKHAVMILEVAVHEGSADAQNKLASMYERGLGVERDPVRAFNLFLQAAEKGHAAAMANLGSMYIEARGVERNDMRGYALIRAALQADLPQIMRDAARGELAAAAGRLDEKQLARAEEMARSISAAFVVVRIP